MDKLKKIYDDILIISKNNHPLDLESAIFICHLIEQYNLKQCLEIGTGYGYSSLFFAVNSQLEVIDTVDKSKDCINYARKQNFTKKINYFCEDIFKWNPEKKYDLIFVDGPKSNQEIIFEKLVHFLDKNGLIIVDNMFLKRVKNNKILEKTSNFKKYLLSLKMFDVSIVNIGDGLAIIKRK